MNPLETLVNVDNIRSTIRRLFQNSVSEIMGELFQNSQRAGATRIDIQSGAGVITFSDNGHGLDGVEGFHTLLKLAESSYQDAKVLDQDPMGVGIHALFAHDGITRVGIRSGNLFLEIDTYRWWNDRDYYTKWHERLVECPDRVDGLNIGVHAKQAVINAFLADLPVGAQKKSSWGGYTGDLLACYGYKGILDIYLDGQEVYTDLPAHVIIQDPLIETTYMGNRLVIALQNQHSGSFLNWYGQLIPLTTGFGYQSITKDRSLGRFRFYLDVREGRPVNPKSPTRQGVIQDAALDALANFVHDQIFAYVAGLEKTPDVGLVHALYGLDHTRAMAGCPFFTFQEFIPQETSEGNLAGVDGTTNLVVGRYADFTLEDDEILVHGSSLVVVDGDDDDEGTVYSYGISSFIDAIGLALFTIKEGNPARLPVSELLWKPGEPNHKGETVFRDLGQWAVIGRTEEWTKANPPAWQDFRAGADHVFGLEDTSSWSPKDATWIIGTTDPVGFLEDFGELCFPEEVDGDYETAKNEFLDNLHEWQRELIGECIKKHFSFGDLQYLFDTHWQGRAKVRISKVEYLYDSPDGAPSHVLVWAEGYANPVRRRLF